MAGVSSLLENVKPLRCQSLFQPGELGVAAPDVKWPTGRKGNPLTSSGLEGISQISGIQNKHAGLQGRGFDFKSQGDGQQSNQQYPAKSLWEPAPIHIAARYPKILADSRGSVCPGHEKKVFPGDIRPGNMEEFFKRMEVLTYVHFS
jgi:hypothetical protein